MNTNIGRLRKDITRLIDKGDLLYYSMERELGIDTFEEQAQKQLGEAAQSFLDKLPDFKTVYEEWYSESLAFLRQILPDRVTHFSNFYEKPKLRKQLSYENYVIQDYMQNLSVADWEGKIKVGPRAALPQYKQQLAILKAAEKRFDSSLFEIRQLVQADVFDGEIDTARELLNKKFFRAAGAIAGVVLEKHLRQVCDDHFIRVAKKHPGIADFNELLKVNSVIDVPQWRYISLLSDLRNLCAHNKQMEPSTEQVTDLVDGVAKILKTVA